jgi:Icc-related predicted phosphoesterase
MKVCAISDLHGQLTFDIEPVDVLFICGDIIPLNIQRDHQKSRRWVRNEFIPWTNKQPVNFIAMVGGNHDFFLTSEDKSRLLFNDTKVKLLYNEGCEYTDYNGKTWTIWGSPLCHIYGNWAFMMSPEYELEQFKKIPDNLDFLITHDAAYGRSDIILDKAKWSGSHICNPELAEVLETKQPKYHFFGHLHSCDHNLIDYNGTKTACVSLLDESYTMTYKPLYLEI